MTKRVKWLIQANMQLALHSKPKWCNVVSDLFGADWNGVNVYLVNIKIVNQILFVLFFVYYLWYFPLWHLLHVGHNIFQCVIASWHTCSPFCITLTSLGSQRAVALSFTLTSPAFNRAVLGRIRINIYIFNAKGFL